MVNAPIPTLVGHEKSEDKSRVGYRDIRQVDIDVVTKIAAELDDQVSTGDIHQRERLKGVHTAVTHGDAQQAAHNGLAHVEDIPVASRDGRVTRDGIITDIDAAVV